MQQEVRRQEQGFRITCWCPTPATRDAAATAIDQALSGQHFLALADGTSGRLIYAGTTVFDQSQNARLYRRDLNYNVEYADDSVERTTRDAVRRSRAEFGVHHCLNTGDSMDMHLVVVRPFGDLARGDIVTDTVRITEILNSEHARSVVRVVAPANKGA